MDIRARKKELRESDVVRCKKNGQQVLDSSSLDLGELPEDLSWLLGMRLVSEVGFWRGKIDGGANQVPHTPYRAGEVQGSKVPLLRALEHPAPGRYYYE